MPNKVVVPNKVRKPARRFQAVPLAEVLKKVIQSDPPAAVGNAARKTEPYAVIVHSGIEKHSSKCNGR